MHEAKRQFFHSVYSGDVKKVDDLLKQGHSPNLRDDQQKTLLSWAALQGHVAIVRMLLAHGAKPGTANPDGWTPLRVAENKGYVAIAHILRNHSVGTVNRLPEVGHLLGDRTALIKMMFGGEDDDVEIIKTLLDKGITSNFDNGSDFTVLSCASMCGCSSIARLLLEHGADPNFGSKSFVALELAASKGYTQIVKMLLAHKADANAENDEGWTALSSAALHNHVETVKVLLEHGANPMQKNVHGENALGWAEHKGYQQVVQLMLDTGIINAAFCDSTSDIETLIQMGANSDAVDELGISALSWAAYNGNVDSVNALLAYKADPNLRSNGGETALDSAASQGHASIVSFLLKRGADANAVDADGWTPLGWAVRDNQMRVSLTLLKGGVDANARDSTGYTPLEHAVENGYVKAVEMLLMYGANPLSKDKDGITALDMATDKEHHQIITLLDKHIEKQQPVELLSNTAPRIETFSPNKQKKADAEKLSAEQHKDDPAILIDNLNKLVGLHQIKADVTQLVNFLRVQRLRKDKGLSVPEQSLHMVFTGNPGTGKTTIARLIAQIYRSMGILSKGQFVETDRAGLVGGYLGQTAIKTQEVVESALGGVLFVDEAYSLTISEAGRDEFGYEAVNTLLKLMEDHRDDLIVIAAGYTEPMQKFIRSNPGLQSRFNKLLHFDDYAPTELTEIFGHFAAQGDYKLHPATELKLHNVFADLYARRDETFGNARLARNLFEKAINAHANRMVSAGMTDEASLVTLYPEDIPSA